MIHFEANYNSGHLIDSSFQLLYFRQMEVFLIPFKELNCIFPFFHDVVDVRFLVVHCLFTGTLFR